MDFKKLFENLAQDNKRKALYVEGRDTVERFLGEAKQAAFIDSYFLTKEDEKPVNSMSLFYIAGPLSGKRYADREAGLRSKTDYYMRVAMDAQDSLVLTFTTSAYASVGKKMGWASGVRSATFENAGALEGEAAQAYFTDIATFLYNAATVIVQKNKRLAREQGLRLPEHPLPR